MTNFVNKYLTILLNNLTFQRMTNLVPNIEFTSAYRQLEQAQKKFVDDFVERLEDEAVRTGEKLKVLLARPLNDLDYRASKFLSSALVRAAISERVEDLTQELEITIHRTLKEVRAIAYSNIGNYFDFSGVNPKISFDKCTPEQLSAIKTLKVKPKMTGPAEIEFVLHDKQAALTNMMRYQNLLDGEAWESEKRRELNAERVLHTDSVNDAGDKYAKMIGN